MPIYETLCILHPELPDARLKELSTWMQKIIEGAGGNIRQAEEWGMRELTYLIKKQRRGYYLRLEYEAPTTAVKELERNLRINESVLRFLSTVSKPLPDIPSQPVSAMPPAEQEQSPTEK